MAYYLQTNGTSDWIQLPSMTFTKIELDTYIEHKTGVYQVYVDGRTGAQYGNFQRRDNDIDEWADSILSVLVDGVTQVNRTAFIPSNQRCNMTVNYNATYTDNVAIFRFHSTGIYYVKGRIYSIKVWNGAALQAHYDMTTQTVQDQSGNGNHATLTGGIWVDDGEGGTSTTHDGSSILAGTASVAATGIKVQNGSIVLTGTGSLVGISDLPNILDGSANFLGSGSLSTQGSVIVHGVSILTGSGQLIGTGNISIAPVTHDGSATLLGGGQLIAIGVEILDPNADIIDTVDLEAVHDLVVSLQGTKLLNISLEGGLKLRTGQNFPVMSGNAKNIGVTIKNKEGKTVDLTGATVKWVVHSSGIQRIYKDTLNGISVVNAQEGEILIHLLNNDTTSLSGEYLHELKVIDSDGKATTVMTGKMNVTKSYIQ